MGWERELVLALQGARSPLVDALLWAPDFVGGTAFYTLALPVAYVLLGRRRGLDFALVLVLHFGLIVALKNGFARPRPFEVLGFEHTYASVQGNSLGYAFPSGHAMGTAAFWLSLAIALQSRSLVWLAAGLTAVVSLSRVWAGVHWPSDVIVGALLGAAVTPLGWWLLRRPFIATHPRRPIVAGAATAAVIGAGLPITLEVLPIVGLAAGFAAAQLAPGGGDDPLDGQGPSAATSRVVHAAIALGGVLVLIAAPRVLPWESLGPAPATRAVVFALAAVWLTAVVPRVVRRAPALATAQGR